MSSGVLDELVRIRATTPERVQEALTARRRRPLLSPTGTLFVVAADHPARGVISAGGDPVAMADREGLLDRLVLALSRPGVDGVMATPDIVDDLALLGALEGKVVFGSINRSGLNGAVFELDDRPTAYTPEAIDASCLDGGKLLLRVDDDDETMPATLVSCAQVVTEMARLRLPVMIEVFATTRRDGRVVTVEDPVALIRAIQIASALGATSAYSWLKLPVTTEMERVLRSSTLPTLLLGGDPTNADVVFEQWRQAMAYPQVFGLVAGRSLLYPRDGDVARAVDLAASIVSAAGDAASSHDR
ncbi:MAG: Cgl0159 family (beta/alpha)8-fold protein [Acidimicrobiales bacterium]